MPEGQPTADEPSVAAASAWPFDGWSPCDWQWLPTCSTGWRYCLSFRWMFEFDCKFLESQMKLMKLS